MKFQLLFLTLLFSSTIFAQVKEADIIYPKIAKELITRRAEDQKGRIKYMKLRKKGKSDTPKFKKFVTEMIAVDQENTNRMREIVAEIGWPTFAKVGGQASNAAWILVQHADRQPDFQAHCLPLLKAGYEIGQVTPFTYAFLYDRVQKSRGERQLYATQPVDHPLTDERSFGSITDEANVQVRRLKLDISRTVEDYATSMGFTYTVPSEEEAKTRAQTARETFESFAAKARNAMADKDYPVAAENYLQASYYSGHMTVEDRLNAARAISLGKHKNARSGIYFLFQAVLLGYPTPQDIITNKEFITIKKERPDNWKELLALIGRKGGQ